MSKFIAALPEAIRDDEAFKGIENTSDLATAFHTKVNAATPSLSDMVSDEYKTSTIIKEAGDVNGLVKQFIDQQAHLGNSLRIPSEQAGEEDKLAFAKKVMEKVPSLMFKPDGAKPEELAEIFKSLGAPEALDGYKLKDGLELSEDVFNPIAQVAFDNKFTNKQLEAVVETIVGMNTSMSEAQTTAQTAEMDGLGKKWGSATDTKMASIVKLAEQTKAPEGLIAALKDKGADAATFEWLDGLVTSLTGGEGINFNNDDTNLKGAMTPSEAKFQISEIMGNAKHPYRDKNHPQHQDWIKPGGEMTKIQKMANPAG